MTKRFTIVMVALALFVLMAIAPVSAALPNGTQIEQGATIFIGEEGLNLTHAVNKAEDSATNGVKGGYYDGVPTNQSIGWWASAAVIKTTAPTKSISLNGRLTSFTVAQADFVGYTGNWYLLDATGAKVMTTTDGYDNPALVVAIADPTLDIKAWDAVNNIDITGKSIVQGTNVRFRIDTNMYAATYAGRNNTIFNITQTGDKYQTNVMPDGTTSAWNYNGTKAPAVVVEKTWNVATPNIWRITNYSYGHQLTYDVFMPEASHTYYWNNSAATTYTGDAWCGRNFTSNANGCDVTGGSMAAGLDSDLTATGAVVALAGANFITNAVDDGFIDLKVKDESGTTFIALYTQSQTSNPTQLSLTKNFVNKQPFFWGINNTVVGGNDFAWVTDAWDGSTTQHAYPAGTYTISAESKLNKMKDNYKNSGADYTGKTVSQTYTITIVSDTVKIEANKDSVVRSKPFSVSVTGKPKTVYWMWVKGTSSMSGNYDDQPPMVALNQEGVYMDNAPAAFVGTHPIGDYVFENAPTPTFTIYDDVGADAKYNKTRYYCQVNTSNSGTRTVEWVTTNWTKAQKYTIRVETRSGVAGAYTYKNDEVDVKVEKGAVTIVAAGDQSYYLGEEIKFTGTNTETYKTYLFLVGPNLYSTGSNINAADKDPRRTNIAAHTKTTTGDELSFKVVDVQGDNTWSWKWGTSNYALDAGTYTIYAVSQPYDKDNLANAAYGTVSIIIKKPFVSATASQSTVAKGDRIYITGTAEGQPTGVQIWVLGKNYAVKNTEAVNSDASFKYEVRQEETKKLYAGQYFVVVQHPMQNNLFDIDQCSDNPRQVCNRQQTSPLNLQSAGHSIFTLLGQGSLQGSDAAEALVQGINSPNVDDTYTKLQFLIEEPIIRIDPIGDKRVGDKFTITAQTNLAVDDEILVQVYSSSFKPTQKSQSGEFSGATGTVKVTKGDSGMNKISFDVDSSTFKPDEYIVTEQAVIQDATGTALFNVLEGQVTVAPTATVVVTTVATPVPTVATPVATVATPAPTPTKSPGYGALIALIGLGAVAFIVVRRH